MEYLVPYLKVLLAFSLWFLAGQIVGHYRMKKKQTYYDKIDALSAQAASEDENELFFAGPRIEMAMWIADVVAILLWPTLRLDEDKALAFQWSIVRKITPIRMYQKQKDGAMREIHPTDD